MINAVYECVLSEYFVAEAVAGRFLDEKEKFFGALGKIFLLDGEETAGLFELTQREEVKEICSDKDFTQYLRVRKYAREASLPAPVDVQTEEVINIKGNAIYTALNHKLKLDEDASHNVIYLNLVNIANSGNVTALRLLGLLLSEGVFVDKNVKAGLGYLRKAGQWNDLTSVLALMHYGKDLCGRYFSRLRLAVKDTPFSSLADTAERVYGVQPRSDVKEAKLLNKLIASAVCASDTYESKYARIIYGEALDFKDKERILFTENKEMLFRIGDLPLKLSRGNIKNFGFGPLQGVCLKRDGEITRIIQNLKNADLRALGTYRPLMLCSDERYLLNMYACALTEEDDAVHTEHIEMGDLTEYDFDLTSNNIFVRSADEDRDNRYFLFFSGDICARAEEVAKSFFKSGVRAKFHLTSPGVTLDLSGILPVCFADRKNAEALKDYCDVVMLDGVSEAEKLCALEDLICGKKAYYGLREITVPSAVFGILKNCPIDQAEAMLDYAVRAVRENGEARLSEDIFRGLSFAQKRNNIGFGGEGNEIV